MFSCLPYLLPYRPWNFKNILSVDTIDALIAGKMPLCDFFTAYYYMTEDLVQYQLPQKENKQDEDEMKIKIYNELKYNHRSYLFFVPKEILHDYLDPYIKDQRP